MKKYINLVLMFAVLLSRFDVPDNDAVEIITALSDHYNYQTHVNDSDGNIIPNPETRVQFINRMVRTNLYQILIQERGRVARENEDNTNRGRFRDLFR